MSRKSGILAVSGILAGGPVVWYVTWILYDLLEFWRNVKNSLYINLAYSLVFVYVAATLFAWKWKSDASQRRDFYEQPASPPLDGSSKKPLVSGSSVKQLLRQGDRSQTPGSILNITYDARVLQDLHNRMEEISEKTADTHAIMKFLGTQKKLEEKNTVEKGGKITGIV